MPGIVIYSGRFFLYFIALYFLWKTAVWQELDLIVMFFGEPSAVMQKRLIYGIADSGKKTASRFMKSILSRYSQPIKSLLHR